MFFTAHDNTISGYASYSPDHKICVVSGKINEHVANNQISYIAASEADHNSSFTGSGLPFPNKQIAFENTKNKGILLLHNDKFTISITQPNSYYARLGTILVPPQLYIEYHNGITTRNITVNLKNSIPYRLLTYPNTRVSSDFYSTLWNLPVRTQEEILYDSDYPAQKSEITSFWSKRPPL